MNQLYHAQLCAHRNVHGRTVGSRLSWRSPLWRSASASASLRSVQRTRARPQAVGDHAGHDARLTAHTANRIISIPRITCDRFWHGFGGLLAPRFPLLASASADRRGGVGMEPAYPVVPATHLCDDRTSPSHRNWFNVILTEVGLRGRIVCRGSRLYFVVPAQVRAGNGSRALDADRARAAARLRVLAADWPERAAVGRRYPQPHRWP